MPTTRPSKSKRGWHNMPKMLKPTTEGKCPYCHKHVKAVEHHIHDQHKVELKRKK